MMSVVNSYMLRRKQKEFAVETIIGMEQGTVAFLFFLETLVMGAAAILVGVVLGVILRRLIICFAGALRKAAFESILK